MDCSKLSSLRLLLTLKIVGTYHRIIGKGIIPKKFFKPFLPKNPIILEAGAHKGNDTLELAKLWPEGKIYAFEPVPTLFAKLKRKTRNFTNVFCYQLALGAKSGNDKMYLSTGASDGSSSLLPPKQLLTIFPTVYFDTKIQVEILTLDDWSKENDIKTIDFLWLDLQGMELKVLKSGRSILKTVKAIYSEVSSVEGYENQNLYSELRSWLENEGFHVEREAVENGEGNVFFLRNSEIFK
jgi:2-O-methyltransferase